jgi:hypothetical protein
MPWIIGIDEAGYGPNLGPLVMTSVACRVPEELIDADFWDILSQAVCRQPGADDERLHIDDSKQVYSTTRGLRALETSVLAAVPIGPGIEDLVLDALIAWSSPGYRAELRAETWYAGATSLPVVAEMTNCLAGVERFSACSRAAGVHWGPVRSLIVCPQRFNAVLDRWGSKGAVLGQGLGELLRNHVDARTDDEGCWFLVDKHGGRNNYAALLQDAVPEGWVMARQESPARSAYRIEGLGKQVHITLQPRADSAYFCVALASMFSKYLRELLMLEFNRFWQARVPDLKATAGYPGDAARFYEAIRPAAREMRIPEVAVWRRR